MEWINMTVAHRFGSDTDSMELNFTTEELWPLFVALVLSEYAILALKGNRPRMAESLNSLGHGILAESVKILTKGIEVSCYASVYRNWRVLDLPQENNFVWLLTFLSVDFAYYFAHRAVHEINFLWAQHQIHHSSEDFNVTVAVRQPISHTWINSVFYLPLALFISPKYYLSFQQFNLIHQAWLHTSLVGTLGPLEYIFNTPTHHKVHHGCNLYVLDKNYGGFLIVWDRLFGTFESQRKNEELILGIVFQHKSFNPFWQMWHKFPGIWDRFKIQTCWKNSLKVIFYGPSWISGSPRLGREQDKVAVRPRPKFRVWIPLWLQIYLAVHFWAIAQVFLDFSQRKGTMSSKSLISTLVFFSMSVTTIGALSERQRWGPFFELFRCLLCLAMSPANYQPGSFLLFAPSALIWGAWIVSLKSPWGNVA